VSEPRRHAVNKTGHPQVLGSISDWVPGRVTRRRKGCVRGFRDLASSLRSRSQIWGGNCFISAARRIPSEARQMFSVAGRSRSGQSAIATAVAQLQKFKIGRAFAFPGSLRSRPYSTASSGKLAERFRASSIPSNPRRDELGVSFIVRDDDQSRNRRCSIWRRNRDGDAECAIHGVLAPWVFKRNERSPDMRNQLRTRPFPSKPLRYRRLDVRPRASLLHLSEHQCEVLGGQVLAVPTDVTVGNSRETGPSYRKTHHGRPS
jgi:hypothetical protein